MFIHYIIIIYVITQLRNELSRNYASYFISVDHVFTLKKI